MMRFHLAVTLVLSLFLPLYATDGNNAMNPIRKVVTLLQSMQKKVEEDGVREEALYKKFKCYCKTGSGDLAASIGAAETKVPAVSTDIESSTAKLTGAKGDLSQAQADRTAAMAAMKEATAIREKEAGVFHGFKTDHETNIAAIRKAVAAISAGVAGSFLQSSFAGVLKQIVAKSDLSDADQGVVSAFLAQPGETQVDYAPQSGQIIGILKELDDEMSANLADATSVENGAISSHGALMAAKTKEVAALTKTIESKSAQIGELGVSLAMMKEDLADTEAALADDKKFLADLGKSCDTKAAEWEERSKTRAAELVALADTIKVLNDDDALDLFKKTLPSASASLIEVRAGVADRRVRAMDTLRNAVSLATAGDKPGLELLALALSGKKTAGQGGFDKVLKLIDDLVVNLKHEQEDDDNKKQFCIAQLDTTDDDKKSLERKVGGEESAIASAQEALSTLTQEIAALEASISALDKSVVDATAQRKDENAEYKASIASNTAATEVLEFAKNRLNQFYNPKLYKPPPGAVQTEEERIFNNLGNPEGLVTTPAPGGIAGTGIAVLAQVRSHKHTAAPAAPPATWDAYASKSAENNGVLSMINLLITDLEKQIAEAKADEKDAQADYDEMTKDAAAKRAADLQSLNEKGTAKADMEESLQAHGAAKMAGEKELMALTKYISSLHGECDWLLKYFDVRKEARAGEVESLGKAKAVLSGADYSLLQRRSFLGRK